MEKIFENFTISILKLNKLVQKIKQYEMQKYNLKAIHVMCGYYLNEFPDGLTAGELVKLTLEDKAAISRAVKSMSETGLAEYDSGRHNSKIKLTQKGKDFAAFLLARSDAAVKAGSADFTDEERNRFYGSLASIVANLEAYYDKLIQSEEDGQNAD